MVINSVDLADGTALEQFARSVRDGLREDWLHDASLFEIDSFERTQVGDRDAYSIAYRVQESPDYCVVDVLETVVIASSLPGNPQGIRARYRMCDWLVREFGEARTRTLDSFRVSTRSSAYYSRFVFAHGITVKASSLVNPAALRRVAESVTKMMVGLRHDMRTCLTRSGAAMAIYPKNGLVVDLPEFARLKGKETPGGWLYDHAGGLGAVRGQPVSATGEWDLLRDHLHAGGVATHEFAHAVMNLCFTEEDHAEIAELYDEALQVKAFPRSYAMTNKSEFFAEMSVAYFNGWSDDLNVDFKLWIHDWRFGNQSVSDALRETYPQIFAFMERVYGAPGP